MKKTALITGASTGIGYALAKLFAKNGNHLVLVARNQEKLEAAANHWTKNYGVSVKVIVQDLSLPAAVEKVYKTIEEENIKIDYLVNNAGAGIYGFFENTDWETEAKMINLNILALTFLTKQILPSMIKRKSGQILNVASVAAFIPGPLMAVYYATKAYVLSFSQALSNECQGTGVSVSTLCPGPVNTEFQSRAKVDQMKLFKQKVLGLPSAEKIAQTAYKRFMKRKKLIVPGLMNKLFLFFLRIAPRGAIPPLVRFIQEPKQK